MGEEFQAVSSQSGYRIAEDLARKAGGPTWEAYQRAYPKDRNNRASTLELKKK